MGIFSEIAHGWKKGWKAGAALEGIFALFPRSSLKGGTIRNAEERDRRETKKLYEDVKALYDASPFAEPDAAEDFMLAVAVDACKRAEKTGNIPLCLALCEITEGFLIEEGSLFGFPEIDWSRKLGLEEGIALRKYLHRKQQFLEDCDHNTELWRENLLEIYAGILAYIPETASTEGEAEDGTLLTFHTPLLDRIEEPAEIIERLVRTMFADDLVEARFFENVRERVETNTLLASGLDPDPRVRYAKKPTIVWPTEARGKTPSDLVELYLRATPFEDLFTYELPFAIPEPVRFEHCHIAGGTGHGKTQLLQLLIHHDLLQAREGKCSVVVIDSQGDLIRTISHLAYFSPQAEQSLADKLLLVDPNDIEHPVGLNMFDVNMERINTYSAVEREKILNGTIELYEYIFGALLGAELTQKQGVIFRYLARLMLLIPNATVQTLRELMEDGKPFKPYMEQLQGTSRKFFETQFFHPSFNATKSQILKRLWGVLSNTTFERMFSHPENKVDLFDAMNSGKIILINTAKDLLKQEGCEIFGRFFIAMIAQAAMERAAIPADKRRPTFVYIDEAQDYFDENIEHLFNSARKYKVSLHVAHQNLGQLGEKLKQSIMASTSIKLAGGVSAKDAHAFAQEMRCDADFIQATRKRKDHTEFACWIKHTTPQAIKITVPLGYVEQQPVLSDEEYEALIAANRARYCTTVAADLEWDITAPIALPEPREAREPAEPASPAAEARPPTRPVQRVTQRPARVHAPPPPLGRGGKEHTYLQQLLQQVAQDRGYRAIIEQPVLEGAGRVDVSLERNGSSIACEISVTSTPEQELDNIRKCLEAGYDQVILVASEPKRLKTIEKFVRSHLEEEHRGRVYFLLPEAFVSHLDEIAARSQATEGTVRGYRVKVTHTAVDAAEAQARRQAIAQVIARSLKHVKGGK